MKKRKPNRIVHFDGWSEVDISTPHQPGTWIKVDPDIVQIVESFNRRVGAKESRGALYAWVSQRGALHRIIMRAKEGQVVDHISGDTLDNRRINLRIVSFTDNCRNASCRVDNKSGKSGVGWIDRLGKWQARISEGGNKINLGFFSRIEDAIAAREAAEVSLGYHGNHGRPSKKSLKYTDSHISGHTVE